MRQSPSYLITTVFQSVNPPYEILSFQFYRFPKKWDLAAGVWPAGRIVIFGRLRMDLDGLNFQIGKISKDFQYFEIISRSK